MSAPVFSVIIPVVDESSTINHTLAHLSQIDSPVLSETIVVDGDAEGKTIDAIHTNEAKKVISARGRGKQMNAGASVARGSILIFLHADTVLPKDAFEDIAAALNLHNYDAGAFDLGIDSGRFMFRVIEKMVSFRSRLLRMPYGDQVIFVKKETFKKLGGFKDIAIMEDVDFIRRLKRTGYRMCVLPQKVLTSPRKWEREGIIYCTLRNWLLISLYLAGVSPDILVKMYYKHRDRH